ncbi:hypothetical protein I6G41_08470 [Staphylococcus equorum]|uniref:hypothetical protein n=1 Tax=Staphylococcus equorum TaxID=246432 RepID=UPI0018D96725|nr:hypothetical protein [Staphylococcus equorum]QPS98544.1 hypothetical protein I6G41_08470 [Staphylococcus equorum]
MFEIEHMNETFDYSLVDDEMAEFLKEREYTINGIAEDARLKIGRELKKTQDKLANHDKGIFYKWFESGGLNKNQVYYYINLVELSTNLDNIQKDNFLNAPKSLQKEVMKKNAPEDLKQEVLDGNITTNKEYQKLQKEKSQLESQLSQAQRSESIALKQLEDAEDKEPEIVERYMEPEDYQSIKNMNEHLESERKYYKKQADNFRDEVKSMMNQTKTEVEFTEDDNQEDYTPILIQLLKPAEEFINYYSHHINNTKAVSEIEKLKNKLKEQ